jgi:hypothetical protein
MKMSHLYFFFFFLVQHTRMQAMGEGLMKAIGSTGRNEGIGGVYKGIGWV